MRSGDHNGTIEIHWLVYQSFIQDFEMEGKQDGSRTIVAGETCACLPGGFGACPPPPPPSRKILNLHPLRFLLTQSVGQISKQHFDDTYLV